MWTESFGVRLHSLHHVHPLTIRFRMCFKQGTSFKLCLTLTRRVREKTIIAVPGLGGRNELFVRN